MEFSDELMKRFVAGHCTDEEEQLVLEFLRQYPAYFEDFCKQNPVLMNDQYNRELDRKQSEYLLTSIYTGIYQHKKAKKKRLMWASGLIAASLLFILFGLNRFKGVPDSAPAQSIAITKVTRNNTTGSIQHWILPDSSTVEALPGASVTYLPAFTTKKREVFLKGEAIFSAHHDASRSFVVICDGVATTALGTRFKVKGGGDIVTVVLYEGKVVVRSKGENENNNYCYLNPGMSTIFYKKYHRFVTTSNFVKRQTTAGSAKPFNTIAEKQNQQGSVIALENLTMQEALDELALRYNVEIQYAPVDIQHMNIIASIPKTQSIGKVLQNLARANGLEILKLGGSAYMIQKDK